MYQPEQTRGQEEEANCEVVVESKYTVVNLCQHFVLICGIVNLCQHFVLICGVVNLCQQSKLICEIVNLYHAKSCLLSSCFGIPKSGHIFDSPLLCPQVWSGRRRGSRRRLQKVSSSFFSLSFGHLQCNHLSGNKCKYRSSDFTFWQTSMQTPHRAESTTGDQMFHLQFLDKLSLKKKKNRFHVKWGRGSSQHLAQLQLLTKLWNVLAMCGAISTGEILDNNGWIFSSYWLTHVTNNWLCDSCGVVTS